MFTISQLSMETHCCCDTFTYTDMCLYLSLAAHSPLRLMAVDLICFWVF